MLFNSIPFAGFFLIFFIIYWFLLNRSLKLQNIFILLGSYIFYGWWNYQFLLLIIFSTGLAYVLGAQIYKAPDIKSKRRILNFGLVVIVGFLIFFKYTNFFIVSADSVFQALHLKIHADPLNIMLPLGISFYTFRLLSYLFDIKNGKFKPVSDWVVFFSYVSFFPSLISGPIDRPKTLIPQLEKSRHFDANQAVNGMRQILWGLFKKAVVANNCAIIADYAFDNHNLHGLILVAGAFFYTIQIYADFSGYSDMAIGIASLIGFNTTRNFSYPYFAQNIAEFWRKWHISLTSWLTEYIFTPVSINLRDFGEWGGVIAVIITFVVSGFWHGANWTFVVWGFLHGCFFIPLILKGKMNKKKEIASEKLLPSFAEFTNIMGTFLVVMFLFILFRAESLYLAIQYYINMCNFSVHIPTVSFSKWQWLMTFLVTVYLFVMEWNARAKAHALEKIGHSWPKIARWSFYILSVVAIVIFAGHEQEFIYFKF